MAIDWRLMVGAEYLPTRFLTKGEAEEAAAWLLTRGIEACVCITTAYERRPWLKEIDDLRAKHEVSREEHEAVLRRLDELRDVLAVMRRREYLLKKRESELNKQERDATTKALVSGHVRSKSSHLGWLEGLGQDSDLMSSGRRLRRTRTWKGK